MKKLISLGLCALAAPAITFGISSVLAQEQPTTTEQAPKDQLTQLTTTARAMQDQRTAQSTHLSSQPANTLLAGELIGSDLKSGTDQNLGSINDFIVDDDGQIVAVIVGVGGVLGIGEKNVTVAWDSVKRTMNRDGDGYVFQANMTDLTLRNAPEYK